MKLKNLACMASILVASLSGVNAATTLTAWNFDNVAIGASSSPAPSTGSGTASAIGLGSSSNPDVQSLSGSQAWRVRGTSPIGWSTNAAVGTQGAKFSAATAGFYQVKVSFDVYATADAEANLQVQYATEGTVWRNATITSVGTGATIQSNSLTNSTVAGSYVTLASGWNNQITADLTGISGVDNDAKFAFRIVNASSSTNCVAVGGGFYNNTSGDWTFDNVVVSGVSYDTIADWTFDDNTNNQTPIVVINNPFPTISNNTATATCLGFNQSYNFPTGGASTNSCDVLNSGAPYSSTPSAQNCWRLRGQPGNGWLSSQPIGSQGAEFDVSTVNFSNILVSFDILYTTQGEAKMCVLYTTNGWATTNVANNLAYGINPTLVVTNDPASASYSVNTIAGTYLFNNYGAIFFNNLIIDFTGVPNVAGNSAFGFRIVNAAMGSDCVNYLGQPYNNNSGNCRLDNVAISGQFAGTVAPTVTIAASATVDAPFTNTFAANPAWAAAITSIYVNSVLLPVSAYTITSSNIVYTPSTNAAVLTVSGLDNIVINATGFTSAKVAQYVATGVAAKLSFAQPAAPSASGGTLTVNPTIGVTDQYGNGTTNPYASFTVTASVSNSVAWTLGGSNVQSIVDGFCVFSNLTATVAGSTAVKGAVIRFDITGYTNTTTHTTITNFFSTAFNIGAPPVPFTPGNLAVVQIDTVAANTTFSIIEVKPSVSKQTAPLNIVPISATGPNALRLSSSGSCGHLSLSDDGTFLVFNAFQDGNSATVDEGFNLNRAVGTLDYTNKFTMPINGQYVSTSFGGSQPRSACSPDNQNFVIDDKGGLYVNNTLVYAQNNLSAKSFGGAAWIETAKVAFPPTPSVYQFNSGSIGNIDWGTPANNGVYVTASGTPQVGGTEQDFCMISTNNSTNCSILYIAQQNAGTGGAFGVINKWSLNSDGYSWTAIGSWTNADNCDNLLATTNASGGVYLYYSSGAGGKSANTIIRLTDQSAGGSLNITTTNTIYTAPSGTSVSGIAFVPQLTPYITQLMPPPILTAQTYAATNITFTVTNTPDDPAWRAAITAITVDGNTLPSAAYTTTGAGKIVFDPSQSASLHRGTNNIVISATGYSANTIAQIVAGAAAKLVVTTQPKNPLASGGVLTNQPVVVVQDAIGDVVYTTASVLASVTNSAWTIGGTTTVAGSASKGTTTFTTLTAFSTTNLTTATIHFTSGSLTAADSAVFTIPAPILANLGGVKLSSGKFAFSFTNATGLSFSVLATNNITAPKATWPVVGTAVENPAGSGNYQFTNTASTNALLFYLLRQP